MFRLAQGIEPATGLCRSDQSAQALAQADIAFGDTRPFVSNVPATWTGVVDGSVSHTNYRCDTALDNTGGQVDFKLASPALGPVDFALDTRFSHQQTSLEFIGSTGVNSQTLILLSGQGELRVTPDIALLVTPEYNYSRNTSPLVKNQDYDQSGVGFGAGYFSSLGNSITLIAKQTTIIGTYPFIVQDGTLSYDASTNSRERRVDAKLTYAPSPPVEIDADVGYESRKDKRVFPSALSGLRNDRTGVVWNLGATYHPDNRTSVRIAAVRQFASIDFLFTSGVVTNDYSAYFAKKLSNTLSSSLNVGYDDQYFYYNLLNNASQPVSNRRLSLDAKVYYKVFGRLDVIFDVSHQKRFGNALVNAFSENSFRIQMSYNLGEKAACNQPTC